VVRYFESTKVKWSVNTVIGGAQVGICYFRSTKAQIANQLHREFAGGSSQGIQMATCHPILAQQ